MTFATLDIEKEPPADWVASFHVAISTNCIYATHDLTVSLRSLRRLLRSDGVLMLVKITRNMFWLDVAVGLFEGWWIMDNRRTHAVKIGGRKTCYARASRLWTERMAICLRPRRSASLRGLRRM